MSAREETFLPDSQPQDDGLLSPSDFAARIRQKHPKVYDELSDDDLTNKIVAKYPEYKASVRMPDAPVAQLWDRVSSEAAPPKVPPVAAPVVPQFLKGAVAQPDLMDEKQFAAKVRAKYPRVYDGLDDLELTRRALNKHEAYRPLVRLPDTALKPSVTSSVNESADFDAPLPAVSPDVEFKPFEASDLPFAARVAAGGANIAGANMQEVPENSPLRGGKLVKATVKTAGDHSYPNTDEMADALLDALGATDVGRRYRAETGRNLITPEIGLEELKRGYDPQSKSYSFEVQPTSADIRIINAYSKGGVKAAEDEIARMRGEVAETDAQQVKAKEAVRETVQKLGFNPDELSEGNGPIAKGLGDAVIGTSRLMNNTAGFFRDPKDSARDAEFIEGAQQAIPAEKTGVGRVVRGVTGVVASAPRYANPLAPVVAAAENLHKGKDEAIEAGLTMGVPAGVARGAGVANQGLSPVAQQVASRNLAGMSNVVTDRVTGNDRSVIESYVEGALLPVGGKSPRAAKSRSQAATGDHPGVLSEVNAAVNLPRSTQASFDDSAFLRQGLVLSILHPKRGVEAFGNSLKALASESKANEVLDAIHASPTAKLRKESGLYLASENRSDGTSFINREEPFASKWAQHIPGVKNSERAYTVMLDSLRSKVFDDYVAAKPDAEPETLQGIARFINYASGRGSLTGVRGIDSTLAQVFYSPRLSVSRPQLLTTPFRGTPETKAYARRELTKYFAATAGFLGMARLAGASVSFDVTDPDFAKIKIGNQRIDLGAGYAQLFRYGAQGATGRGRSLKLGREYEADRGAVVERFFRTKLSPQAGLVVNLAKGEDLRGQKTNLGQEAKKLLVPLSFGDIYDAWEDAGVGGAALGSLSLFGAAVSTIKPPTDEEQLNEQIERLKAQPENKGLDDSFIRHNARVRVAISPLLREIEDSELGDAEKETLRHKLNSYLYPAAARPGERRQLEALERVAAERLKGVEDFIRQRIDALKGKSKPISENKPPEWEAFPDDSGSLNIPRASMPQVKSEHRGAMVQFLRGRGISHSAERVAPNTLKPSQAEFSPEKVEKARGFEGPQRPVLVSSDGYVADGHHQWLSGFTDAPETPIKAIRLDAPIEQLLVEMARFPSSGIDDSTVGS
jgi:hypothetical protein